MISIHAPRMGSDTERVNRSGSNRDFNPRSPHGERRKLNAGAFLRPRFQSTLPAWGATDYFTSALPWPQFQSTLPAWGATTKQMLHNRLHKISIHAPRMGSDSTAKAYSNDRIKWSTLREPHFFYSKNACFSPIVSMCATTSRTKKSENQSFIRIISRLGPYVFHLRLVSIPQIIEPYAVRLLVHQHFQCGTK